MTAEEWLTTREVAERLGLRHLKSLRERLEREGVRSRRLGRLGRIRWLWSDVEARFSARCTWHERAVTGGSGR